MGNLKKVIKSYPKTFWVANFMELFERWAWYGLFAVLALYLTESTDEGALGFSSTQKGMLMGTVTSILYFLPIITGALADKAGYKKTLILAYTILASGYLLMGIFTQYWSVYLAFLWIAVGAAIFKPVISATITKTTTAENSSIGFGLFYMIVNIGGFLGPVFSSKLRAAFGWNIIFVMAASAIIINMIIVLFFYTEPGKDENKNEPKLSIGGTITQSLKNIWEALKDFRLLIFLIIMTGFWTMFNQLFYTLPSFIAQWVDTPALYSSINDISPWLAEAIGNKKTGNISAEMLIQLDSLSIILLQVLVSSFVMRLRPVNSIISGLVINAIGIGLAFATQNPFFVVFGIFIFAIGEMAGSPKFTEYVGRIAPKGKEALYMGTSFLPVAAGNFFTGFLSGPVYENMSDKPALIQQEVAKRGLEIPQISETFSQNDYFAKAAELMGMKQIELTEYLWNSYQPQNIWYVFTAIGAVTAIALILYDKLMLKDDTKKAKG